MVSLELFARNLRYALRNLVSSPGFTAAAVLSLALGIGASSTIFSFLDAVLLRPLDVPRAGELVKVSASTVQFRFGRHTYREFVAFRDRNTTLTGLTAQSTEWLALSTANERQPRTSYAQLVDGDFFQTLEVPAALGRTLTPLDDRPGRPIAVVLSDRAWSTRFNADAAIVGSAATVNGQPATIVGVLPPTFGGTDMNERPDLYAPLSAAERLLPFAAPLEDPSRAPHLVVFGRLRPGVAVATAQADLSTIATALQTEYPETNRERSVAVMGEVAARFARAPQNEGLVVLLGGFVAIVLLIACLNVANLLLGRAGARGRELTIRSALGASRSRLMGQLLTESVVLAALGAVAGLVLASWAIQLFATLQVPADTPMELSARLDARVLLSTLTAMTASVVLFGLWPSLRASRVDLTARETAGRRSRYWGRHALVAAQTSLAALLLVIAGLSLESFTFVSRVSPGFRVDNVLLAAVDPTAAGYGGPRARQVYEAIEERVRALPGVRSVALARFVPLDVTEGYDLVTRVEEDPADTRNARSTLFNVVTPDYFTTMDTPVLRGRVFDARDTNTSPRVAVVSEAMEHWLWPETGALGRRFRIGGSGGTVVEVVGVARDAKYEQLQETPLPYYYLPYAQEWPTRMSLIVWTAGDPGAVAEPLREAVLAVQGDVPIETRTLRDLVDGYALMPARLISGIVGVMALAGLSLGVIGLYAVVAFVVSRRIREIGIRMALGGTRGAVLWSVLRSGLQVTLIGLTAGLGLAWLITPGFGANLPGIDHHDPMTFGGVALLVAGVALAASWIPAKRAASVDPATTLREG